MRLSKIGLLRCVVDGFLAFFFLKGLMTIQIFTETYRHFCFSWSTEKGRPLKENLFL